MVATRNHPKEFPDPTESASKASPTKRTTRNSAAASEPLSPTRSSRSTTSVTSRRAASGWSHTPSNLTLIWLAISLPLVIWDTGYVLLRPHSMPGGKLHYPIWAPYELYGRVDKVYGFDAWDNHNGWTAAQGLVNAFETTAYLIYLYIVFSKGEQEPIQGRGAPDRSFMGQFRALGESRTVDGKLATVAVLIAYSTATVTFWKTVLYWLIEVFSGFHMVGHNDWATLIFLWILPNGPWLVFPLYMMYVMGAEILEGLEAATSKKSK